MFQKINTVASINNSQCILMIQLYGLTTFMKKTAMYSNRAEYIDTTPYAEGGLTDWVGSVFNVFAHIFCF